MDNDIQRGEERAVDDLLCCLDYTLVQLPYHTVMQFVSRLSLDEW